MSAGSSDACLSTGYMLWLRSVSSSKTLNSRLPHWAGWVSMEGNKVSAVTDWPESSTVKELQGFLGFANI